MNAQVAGMMILMASTVFFVFLVVMVALPYIPQPAHISSEYVP